MCACIQGIKCGTFVSGNRPRLILLNTGSIIFMIFIIVKSVSHCIEHGKTPADSQLMKWQDLLMRNMSFLWSEIKETAVWKRQRKQLKKNHNFKINIERAWWMEQEMLFNYFMSFNILIIYLILQTSWCLLKRSITACASRCLGKEISHEKKWQSFF